MGDGDPQADLRRSWVANAGAWAEAVRSGIIASRWLATDAAVVQTILALGPRKVLDLGCGEGWLARALAETGIEVVGTDASEALVESARALGGGTFLRLGYEDIVADPAAAGTGFDLAVANFSLLGEEVAPLLQAVPARRLVIQTVHPAALPPPYRDGWRTEDFRSFGEGWAPMPWYFRTLGSWVSLLRDAGYALADLREPTHPDSGALLSLLLVAERR